MLDKNGNEIRRGDTIRKAYETGVASGRGATKIKAKTVTFADQAEKFLADGATRKRNPLRPASLRTYRTVLNTLLPLIGKLSLETVGNKVVKDVVTKLSDEGYSARSIALNVVLIKKIRRSAISEDGDPLFPYEWNTDVIDAPSTDGDKQPTVSAQQVQDAISKADTSRKALYALLASTGLRIAEALAIKAGPDDGVSTIWLPFESKIIVRQQMTRTGLGPTKTKAGVREVDLAPELNEYLSKIVNSDTALYPVFMESESNYRGLLKKDGIAGGFHAFRRFRITHLRLSGVPDALIKFWVGHAAGNVTEHYTQVAGEIESRKSWAAKAGIGFKLPEAE
jgi:integrase